MLTFEDINMEKEVLEMKNDNLLLETKVYEIL